MSNIHNFTITIKGIKNVISTNQQNKRNLGSTINIKVGKRLMTLVNKHTVVFVWLYNFAVFKICFVNTQEEEDWNWQSIGRSIFIFYALHQSQSSSFTT